MSRGLKKWTIKYNSTTLLCFLSVLIVLIEKTRGKKVIMAFHHFRVV